MTCSVLPLQWLFLTMLRLYLFISAVDYFLCSFSFVKEKNGITCSGSFIYIALSFFVVYFFQRKIKTSNLMRRKGNRKYSLGNISRAIESREVFELHCYYTEYNTYKKHHQVHHQPANSFHIILLGTSIIIAKYFTVLANNFRQSTVAMS